MGDIAPELDNVHPALAACWHPVCRSADVAEGAIVADPAAGRRLGDRPHRRRDRRPRRPLPAPRLAAERRLRRRRHRPLRLPRLPLRARRPLRRDPRPRHGRDDPAQGRRPRRRRGRRALRPRLAGAGASRWHRSSTCPSGTTRRSSSPRCPTRRGTPARRRWSTTSSTSPTSRSPTSATFGDPDDIEVPPYSVERDGLAFTCDYVHSTKRLADSMGAERVRGRRRGARRGGTSPRSPSGCASTTRPTTSC